MTTASQVVLGCCVVQRFFPSYYDDECCVAGEWLFFNYLHFSSYATGWSQLDSCVFTEQAPGCTGLPAPKPFSSMCEPSPDELPLGETDAGVSPYRILSVFTIKCYCILSIKEQNVQLWSHACTDTWGAFCTTHAKTQKMKSFLRACQHHLLLLWCVHGVGWCH